MNIRYHFWGCIGLYSYNLTRTAFHLYCLSVNSEIFFLKYHGFSETYTFTFTKNIPCCFMMKVLCCVCFSCSDSPDFIVVRDGIDATNPVIQQYCNTVNGEHIQSTGEHLYIEFIVNDRKQRQGFAATYEFIKEVPPIYPTPSKLPVYIPPGTVPVYIDNKDPNIGKCTSHLYIYSTETINLHLLSTYSFHFHCIVLLRLYVCMRV